MKLIAVSCTMEKDEKTFFDNFPLGKSVKKNTDIYESIIFFDNKKGLSECYNEAIEKAKQDKMLEDSVLLFCHDDLSLGDIFLKEKLEKAFETFDVVGDRKSVV